MKVPKLNMLFRLLDYLLWPFMFLLGGFKFPIQETHPWHVKRWNRKLRGTKIKGNDTESKFGQSGISKHLGLYHMPILGGLKKYVVLENNYYKNYWNIGWDNYLQILRLYDSKVKLLVGKEGYNAFGLSDGDNETRLKIIGFGELGDNKYNNLRLF